MLRRACHRDFPGSCVEQISNELVQYYHIEGLEEVRVIRDRQTSMLGALLKFMLFYKSTNDLQRNRDNWDFFDSEASVIRVLSWNPTTRLSTFTGQILLAPAVAESGLHTAVNERTEPERNLKATGSAKS